MAKKETTTETAQTEEQTANNSIENTNAEEAKTEETTVESSENVTQEEIDNTEVPENAEEISQEEALEEASNEVNRLREENTAIKQQLDDKITELQNIVAKTNEEAEIAGKQILELEAKVKELETKLAEAISGTNNTLYIELLDKFDAQIDEYAGLRRERLRKEFITDLKEEIQRQKDLLTNA